MQLQPVMNTTELEKIESKRLCYVITVFYLIFIGLLVYYTQNRYFQKGSTVNQTTHDEHHRANATITT